MNKGLRSFLKILHAFSCASFAGVSLYLFSTGLLPMTWRMAYLVSSALFFFLTGLAVFKRQNMTAGLAAFLILIFMITGAFNIAVGFYAYKSVHALQAIHIDNKVEKKESEKGAEPIEGDDELTKSDFDEAFNIYISGNDVYGDLSKVSRSDVNLILTVNMNAKKMLITTVPRDTYLPIQGGGGGYKDKLTHAGIYGVEASVKTLEDFLETPIPYYARVNFTTMIRLVDVLGGIEVDNPERFKALHGSGKTFSKGLITLDGKDALAFSRERYSLAEGDIGRGKNHIRVLKAMIQKALSPALLTNYPELLAVATESTDTNIPTKTIIKWINRELEKPGGWEIATVDVQGTGSMNHKSYAMPDHKLYMMIPSEDSVARVQAAIHDTLTEDQY